MSADLINNTTSATFPSIGLLDIHHEGYLSCNDLQSFFQKHGSKAFNVLHVNCRSLSKNFDDISLLLSEQASSVSVMGACETWLSENTDHLFNITGYQFVNNNRVHRTGGGVAFYVLNSLKYNIINELSIMEDFMECLFIELLLPRDTKLLMGCVYRPPNTNVGQFLIKVEELLSLKILGSYKYKLLMGDFNLDAIKCNSHKPTDDFLTLMLSSGYQPLINYPTRVNEFSATLLDNFFLNVEYPRNPVVSSSIILTDFSDHFTLACSLSIETPAVLLSDKQYGPITKFNKKLCYEVVKNYDWHIFNNSYLNAPAVNVNDAYDKFEKVISDAVNGATSYCYTNKKVQPKMPWMTLGLARSSKNKYELYNQYLKNPTPDNKQNYVTFRNKLNSLIKQTKRNYYVKKVHEYAGQSRQTWKIINELLNKKGRDISELCRINYNSIRIESPSEIAKCLNDYFSSIGAKLAQSIQAHVDHKEYLSGIPSNPNSMYWFDSTPIEVNNVISNFPSKKTRGHDGISMTVLKQLSDIIDVPISSLFNKMVNQGIFPDSLKIAKVVPVFKAGNREEVNNYRPISILPALSKIFEKLLYNRLYNYLENFKILTTHQYGFRRNHSTTLAILDFQEKLAQALDEGKCSIGVFLDLSKAFDAIEHQILINKLQHYGVRGTALNLLINYLSNRKQFVFVNGVSSGTLPIEYGVPQGSILGPLLFLIFINDLPCVSKWFEFIIFADDTNLLMSHFDVNYLYEMANNELQKISLWFKANKLHLNINKTNFIHFGHRKPDNANLSIDNTPIKQLSETKFLGVIIDERLNWSHHIMHISTKLQRVIGTISRIKNYLPKNVLFSLYCSLGLPHLLYAILVWGNADKIYLRKLEILQNKLIRFILNAAFATNINHLYYCAQLLMLKDLFKLQCGLFMLKLRNNALPSVCNKYIIDNKTQYSLRSCHLFNHGFAKLKCNYNSIKFYGPRLWSSLPPSLNQLTSVNSFRVKFTAHCLSLYKFQ